MLYMIVWVEIKPAHVGCDQILLQDNTIVNEPKKVAGLCVHTEKMIMGIRQVKPRGGESIYLRLDLFSCSCEISRCHSIANKSSLFRWRSGCVHKPSLHIIICLSSHVYDSQSFRSIARHALGEEIRCSHDNRPA